MNIQPLISPFFIFVTAFFFFTHFSFTYSQYRIADSLLSSLKIVKEDSSVIMTYIRLSRLYEGQDPEMSLGYAQKALTLSRRSDFNKGIGLAMKLMGNYQYDKSDFDKALRYYRVAFGILSRAGDLPGASGTLTNIGNVYGVKGEYDKCLEFFLMSLQIDESIGNKKGIAVTTSNIGELYVMKGNLDEGVKYHYRSLAIKKEMNITDGLARSLNNIGMVYSLKNMIDSAIPYLSRSIMIAEQNNNVPDMVNAYGNLCSAWMNSGNVDSALYYGLKTAEHSDRAGNRYGQGLSYIECARMFTALKKYKEAFMYTRKGLSIGEDLASRFIIASAYLQFATTYGAMNIFDSAYYFSSKYSLIKDSLLNEESSKQMAEMATRFETEKKQKAIELQSEKIKRQQTDISRQRIISFGIAVCLALALLLAFFIFRGYKQKKSANAMLEKKNAEITRQKIVIEEKNMNITDSINYANRIQQAILKPVEVVRNTFCNCFIIYRPKDIISGDFYFFEKVNDWILCAAVDCTGHGVPGALISMIGNSLLNEVAADPSVKDLSMLFNELDIKLKKALNPAGFETTVQDGMDLSMVAYNGNSKQLQLGGANNPVLLMRKGVCTEVEPARFGIGDYLKGDKNFIHRTVIAETGDMLYLYTDGFEDQLGGPKGKKFKSKRFKELLSDISGNNINEQQTILESTFEEWKGHGEQTDDVTVIGIRV